MGSGLLQGDPLSEATEIRIDSASQILTQTDLQISITCAITLARLRTPQSHCGELKVTWKIVLRLLRHKAQGFFQRLPWKGRSQDKHVIRTRVDCSSLAQETKNMEQVSTNLCHGDLTCYGGKRGIVQGKLLLWVRCAASQKHLSQADSPSKEDAGTWPVVLLHFFSQLPGKYSCLSPCTNDHSIVTTSLQYFWKDISPLSSS